MTAPLWLIAALAVGTMLIKAAGPVLLGGRTLPRSVDAMMALAGPVLLAALAAVLTFADGPELVIDSRAGGLLVAGIGVLLRLPLLVIVVAAGITTAMLRAAGLGA